jgi:hypothetical protein
MINVVTSWVSLSLMLCIISIPLLSGAIVNTPPYYALLFLCWPALLNESKAERSDINGIFLGFQESSNHASQWNRWDYGQEYFSLRWIWTTHVIIRFPSLKRKPMANHGNKSLSWAGAIGVKLNGRTRNGSSKSAWRKKREWAKQLATRCGHLRRDGQILESLYLIAIYPYQGWFPNIIYYTISQ